jgi:hypothetical protein
LDLGSTVLASDAVAAKAKLQAVLDQSQDARPTELDRQFEASRTGKVKKKAK